MAELSFTLNFFSVCVEVDDMYMYVDICGCHRKSQTLLFGSHPPCFLSPHWLEVSRQGRLTEDFQSLSLLLYLAVYMGAGELNSGPPTICLLSHLSDPLLGFYASRRRALGYSG